jgi:predicted enzyme related to lactoylglutathione lyase
MNRVVHFEIHAEDLERAKKFYSDVFGWQMQQMGSEMGNYVVIVNGPGMDNLAALPEDPGINGGMLQRNAPIPAQGQGPNAYVCIIGVENIDSYMAKVEAAGGKPQTDKMDVPGVGLLRYYKDTEGNIFGMLQPVMSVK